jgi:colanic acid/amylovoran biosynthesis glycosyltransferase
MASGLPVLATRHAGIPAVVGHEQTGLLVDEADIPALADALQRLLTDPSLRRRLGEAGAQRASQELDLHAKTIELEAIYDELLD